MPNVKLAALDHYGFSTEMKIRVSDLNYGGHLGYDRILTLAHQARLELFDQWGVSELDLGDGITGIVAGDSVVNYLGEGFLNDVLAIEIQAIEVGAVVFRLAHRFTKAADGSAVALAEVGFVGFNYQTRRPSRLPGSFIDHLSSMGNA